MGPFVYTATVYNKYYKGEATDNLICNAKKIDCMEGRRNKAVSSF